MIFSAHTPCFSISHLHGYSVPSFYGQITQLNMRCPRYAEGNFIWF